jgi:transglutaminase-like putative cysteine protease
MIGEAERRSRLWIGWLALLAPLPLPFNDVIEWPVLAAYCLLLLWWLRRVHKARFRPLPRWAVNLMGLAYIPLLPLDVTGLSGGSLLRPILHLLLFGLLVKMFGLRRNRELPQLLLTCFFVFVASMATSVHPTVVLYLIVWLTVATMAMARMTWAQTLSGYGVRGQDAAAAPFTRLATGATVATVLCAVPLFFFLPRTGSPIVTGPAVAARGEGAGGLESGMTDVVGLDVIGRIRQSRAVALRMEQTPATPNPATLRFKVATYVRYQGARWRTEALRRRALKTSGDGVVLLRHTAPVSWAELWIQPLGSTHLPLPLQAVAISGRLHGLTMDAGGNIFLFYAPSGTLRARIGLARTPRSLAAPPRRLEEDSALLDTSEVTPRMANLAQRVAGDRSPAAAAEALQDYLLSRYAYTTDLVAGSSGNPLDDFLFETRRGHCEYFASSMVLLLRSLGIPARLVTGFLGAELNPIEDYLIVRQSNAHAWVEAWLPDRGWQTFDPTPPDGRPQAATANLRQTLSQAWDLLVFRWDRYVLGYGLNDQLSVFWGLRSWFGRVRNLFRNLSPGGAEPELLSRETPATAVPDQPAPALQPAPFPWWSVVLVVLAVGFAWLWLRRRATRTATDAWIDLLAEARRCGQTVPASTPPLAAASRLADAFPVVAASIQRLLDGYVRESFAGWRVALDSLEADLQRALRAMRQ